MDGPPLLDRAPDADYDGRSLVPRVHARLRAMILTGEAAPGALLLQATMARVLGVSRTPMREAFRLLQEEGLIETAPDQRARVRAVDAAELDSTYGSRIVLEALGVSVTVRDTSRDVADDLWAALRSMRASAGAPLAEAWYPAHREFHRISTVGVAAQTARHLASLREQCERYIRLDRIGHAGAVARADAEHEQLAAAFADRDESMAVTTIARHLARTSLSIMADIAPEREPVATRAALHQVEGSTAVRALPTRRDRVPRLADGAQGDVARAGA